MPHSSRHWCATASAPRRSSTSRQACFGSSTRSSCATTRNDSARRSSCGVGGTDRRWRVTISSGGHPLPVRATPSSADIVGRPGTLLGVLTKVEFHDVDIELDEATVLVAYTDGVSEARRDRELFGEERILELVGSVHDEPADEVVFGRLVDAALDFGGEPESGRHRRHRSSSDPHWLIATTRDHPREAWGGAVGRMVGWVSGPSARTCFGQFRGASTEERHVRKLRARQRVDDASLVESIAASCR